MGTTADMGLFRNNSSVKNGTTTRTIVCQGCFHRLQARFEEPTRKHSPFERGRTGRQRPCRMVHWKEMCFCLQGKEQDLCSRQIRKVQPSCHLGQSYPHPWKRWTRQGQVRQEPASYRYGPTSEDYDVPFKNLNN